MSSYFEEEERLQEALLYKEAHSRAILCFLAWQFSVSKDRIHCRLKDRDSRITRPPVNQKLDKDQDLALCWYIESLHRIGVPLRYKAIAQAANQILAASHHRDNPPPTVEEYWRSPWLRTHPQYTMMKEKLIESEQQQAMNFEDICQFFNRFDRAKTENKIETVDIWNMDESEFRVGVG